MVDKRVPEDISLHALVGGVVIFGDGVVAGTGAVVVGVIVAGG